VLFRLSLQPSTYTEGEGSLIKEVSFRGRPGGTGGVPNLRAPFRRILPNSFILPDIHILEGPTYGGLTGGSENGAQLHIKKEVRRFFYSRSYVESITLLGQIYY
jgi:hypothetical protein